MSIVATAFCIAPISQLGQNRTTKKETDKKPTPMFVKYIKLPKERYIVFFFSSGFLLILSELRLKASPLPSPLRITRSVRSYDGFCTRLSVPGLFRWSRCRKWAKCRFTGTNGFQVKVENERIQWCCELALSSAPQK